MNILNIALLFSSVAFLFYGANCLLSKKMKDEFVRFGLEKQRILTGYLQLFGALGLIFGYLFFPLLIFIASVGLAILMFLGFAVRLKIKDSLLESLPSLIFGLINLFICVSFYYKFNLS
ncbi:DoxX family protein [Winogradskyella sp. PG-2]|uniref:DoxX family protein n=1 Tax=Winogradskyella sp. PG-2 TaxID=754409 RepID=UPI0005F07140|nr:DoxX family protein [Winogradskyella sp. PG-2]